MTTYSQKYKKDLPLTVRLVDAKRHDSLTAMLALVDLRETTPEISVETFLGDSATDCGAMYSLLDHFHIQTVIDLNHRAKDTSLGDIQMVNHHPVPCGFEHDLFGTVETKYAYTHQIPLPRQNEERRHMSVVNTVLTF